MSFELALLPDRNTCEASNQNRLPTTLEVPAESVEKRVIYNHGVTIEELHVHRGAFWACVTNLVRTAEMKERYRAFGSDQDTKKKSVEFSRVGHVYNSTHPDHPFYELRTQIERAPLAVLRPDDFPANVLDAVHYNLWLKDMTHVYDRIYMEAVMAGLQKLFDHHHVRPEDWIARANPGFSNSVIEWPHYHVMIHSGCRISGTYSI